VHGEFKCGQLAASVTLDVFSVDVAQQKPDVRRLGLTPGISIQVRKMQKDPGRG
jgi:hypothetical protein